MGGEREGRGRGEGGDREGDVCLIRGLLAPRINREKGRGEEQEQKRGGDGGEKMRRTTKDTTSGKLARTLKYNSDIISELPSATILEY